MCGQFPSCDDGFKLLQHCYDHCKSTVMGLIAEQLNRLFSIDKSPDHRHPTLPDLSIAYGLLLKGCVGDAQHLSDKLCQEVRCQEQRYCGLQERLSAKQCSYIHLLGRYKGQNGSLYAPYM